MAIQIRPVDIESDTPAIAAITNTIETEPFTPDQVKSWLTRLPPGWVYRLSPGIWLDILDDLHHSLFVCCRA